MSRYVAILVVALACASACGVRKQAPLIVPTKFPQPLPRVELPMLDPLEQPELSVEATLESSGGRRKTLWMLVDSGANLCTMPDGVLRDLGIVTSGNVEVDTLGGGSVLAPIASLPRLAVGGLTVERLSVGVVSLPLSLRDRGVLGRSVLDQAPWEVDWDRGVVTLNALVWRETSDVWSLPLVAIEGERRLLVDVRLNGVPTRAVFDTGAERSIIPAKLAKQLRLPAASLDYEGMSGAGGPIAATGRLLLARVGLGPRELGRELFVEENTDDYPVLGVTALAAYELQVIPGRRVLFRPRNPDMQATAEARVRRWSWMRHTCRNVGCVRGYVEGSGDYGRIAFEFEQETPRPLEVQFGCAAMPGPDWLGLRGGDRFAAPYRHVRLILYRGAVTAFEQRVPNIDQKLMLPNGQSCRELVALDVTPLREPQRPGRDGYVYLMH